MDHLHYIHFRKKWCYWVDERGYIKLLNPYYSNGVFDPKLKEIPDSQYKTEGQVKRILKQMFPDLVPEKTIPFHMGHRDKKYKPKRKRNKRVTDLD